MIDHCVAALSAQTEEKIFRTYVTDAIKALVENSTHYLIPGYGVADYGITLTSRWADGPAERAPEPPADDRSCAEIAAGVWERMRHGR